MSKMIMYEKIYQDILQKIANGTYAKGDMLPSENELARQYGVSRITTNRAMGMLVNAGVVQRIQGKGTLVAGEPETEEENAAVKTEGIRKESIGVIVDTIGAAYGEVLVRGIERGARENGLNMFFYCTYGDKEEETRAINSAVAGGAGGLVLMCTQGDTYNSCILDMMAVKFPIVLIDRGMQGLDLPCVRTDNYAAAKELTELLIAKGHKKICFVTHASRSTPTILERYHAFRDCIAEHTDVQGIVRELVRYKTTPKIREAAMDSDLSEIKKMIEDERENTAFFTVEYKMAILMDRALRSLGMEKEIATFDGIEPIMDDRHHFLQVIQDEYQMGYKAVCLLKEKMNGKEAGFDASIHIPYHIVS